MVDYYGNWTYRKNTPPDRMCDMDRVAQMVDAAGYEPMTSMENIVSMIVLSYQGYLDDNNVDFYAIENDPDDLMINAEDVESYILDNGGFVEFDYYC